METKEIKLKNGVTVTIKNKVDTADISSICKGVADTIIDIETGDYYPELLESVTDIYLAMFYTDINMPKNYNEQCNVVDQNLVDAMNEVIDGGQHALIRKSIDARIEHNLRMSENGLMGELAHSVAAFKDATSKIGDMYKNIDAGEMDKFIKKVNTLGEIDEEKLLKAAVAAGKKTSRKKTSVAVDKE